MRKEYVRYLILSLIIVFVSCNSSNNSTVSEQDIDLEVFYNTAHFTVFKGNDFYVLEVSSIFQNFDGKERYVFYPKEKEQPNLPNITHYISTPVHSLTISSTTHLGFLNALNKSDAIIAAKDMKFAYDQDFAQQLEAGELIDIGGQEYNVEKLLELKEELNIAYAIDGEGYREIQQLRNKGERFMMLAEFMEDEPLAKSKWLLIVAMLFGEEMMQEAIVTLEQIEERYNILREKVIHLEEKPKVMIGLPWSGSWYVSGGNSFQARFIADAGGHYVWEDIDAKASVPISVERVFQDALNADLWINPGDAESLSQIEKRDERFMNLGPIKNQKVFNQNKRYSVNNGNDYWESGVIYPDVILADLISIFHPEVLPEHKLYYYQKLQP